MTFKQRYSVSRTIEPAQMPVGLDELKLSIGETSTDNDGLLTGMLLAATRTIERFLRSTLITTTYTMLLDHYPGQPLPWWSGVRQGANTELTELTGEIELPFSPLLAITSITSNLDDGTTSVFSASNYLVDTSSRPGRVIPTRSSSWPYDLLQALNGVEIIYTAGYGPAQADVPEDIREAIKIWVANIFNNKDGSLMKKEKVGESDYERFSPDNISLPAKNLLTGYKIWTL